MLGLRKQEKNQVIGFFLVFLIISIASTIGRSIAMTLLIGNLGIESLPIMFILVDGMVFFGSMIYAKYTARTPSIKIFQILILIFALFTGCMRFVFFLGIPWVFGVFFVGYFLTFILVSIHSGSFVATYLTSIQLKRLSSLIYSGVQIGNMLGGILLVFLLGFFSPEWLLLAVPFFALLSLLGVRWVGKMTAPIFSHSPAPKKKSAWQNTKETFNFTLTFPLMRFCF